MEKDDKENLISLFLVLFLIWNLVILFAFWGGNPRGVYWRCVDLQKILDMQCNHIIELDKERREWREKFAALSKNDLNLLYLLTVKEKQLELKISNLGLTVESIPKNKKYKKSAK